MKIDITKRAKFSTTIFLLLTGIGVGGLFGAVTNMINGGVSQSYYRVVLGWQFEDIWYAAVLQGIYEGLIYGFIYSSLYTIAFAFLIRKRVSYLWAVNSYLPILQTHSSRKLVIRLLAQASASAIDKKRIVYLLNKQKI